MCTLVTKLGNINIRMSPSVYRPSVPQYYFMRYCGGDDAKKKMGDKLFPSQKRHISQCRPVCKIFVGVTSAVFQKELVRRQKNI